MKKFNSVEEVLVFAIERETEAHDFYTELAERVENPALKKALEGFAFEELGHKMKLEAVRESELVINAEEVHGLAIADYVVDVKARDDMDYADALLIAMKKEKAAFRLYSDLAELSEDAKLREMFLALAAEEAKHKLRFEVEYDDEVLKED